MSPELGDPLLTPILDPGRVRRAPGYSDHRPGRPTDQPDAAPGQLRFADELNQPVECIHVGLMDAERSAHDHQMAELWILGLPALRDPHEMCDPAGVARDGPGLPLLPGAAVEHVDEDPVAVVGVPDPLTVDPDTARGSPESVSSVTPIGGSGGRLSALSFEALAPVGIVSSTTSAATATMVVAAATRSATRIMASCSPLTPSGPTVPGGPIGAVYSTSGGGNGISFTARAAGVGSEAPALRPRCAYEASRYARVSEPDG